MPIGVAEVVQIGVALGVAWGAVRLWAVVRGLLW